MNAGVQRLRRAERGQGLPAGPTTDEGERIEALEREVRELRQASGILGKASACFAMAALDRRSRPSTRRIDPVRAGIAFIDAHRTVRGAEPIRGLLPIAPSACYAHLALRCTERSAEAGVEPSAGSGGDPYDNALAATVNGLFKAEAIHGRGPRRAFAAVAFATPERVDRFNRPRLLEPTGHAPPAEAAARCHAGMDGRTAITAPAAQPKPISLRQARRGSLRHRLRRAGDGVGPARDQRRYTPALARSPETRRRIAAIINARADCAGYISVVELGRVRVRPLRRPF